MNILIITPYIPYPLSEGGKISQYAEIDSLKENYCITLALTANNKTDLENILILKNQWKQIEIKIINLIPKEKNVQSRRKRSINFLNYAIAIKSRIKKILNIYFQPKLKKKNNNGILNTDIKNESHNEFDQPYLQKLPAIKSRHFIDQLSKIITQKKYDFIQVEHFDFMELVFLFPKTVKKIFVHHEIRFARLKSFKNWDDNRYSEYENYVLSAIKTAEVNILKNYDAVFVFTEDDKKRLQNELPEAKIYVSPFPVLDSYIQNISNEKLRIDKLVFVGGEKHTPNKDAIQWFVSEIGPIVYARYDLCLHVIGHWNQDFIDLYKDNKSIYFSGYVEDIISYCKNSIMIVPVRIGSGIRTKILYAMAQGVPVISTTTASEGIIANDHKSILIANTASEFVESIGQLINNPDSTHQMILNSQHIILDSYSQKATAEVRNKFLRQIASSESLMEKNA